MITIKDLLRQHRFLLELPEADLELLAGCGKNVAVHAGQYLAHEGDPADQFYLIRHGKIAIETHSPGHGAIVLETLGEGEVVGWSWLFPPHSWVVDARAVEETRLVAMDGRCLRGKVETDPALGYRLMKPFSRVMVERLRAARLQLADVYGHRPG